MAGSSVQYWQVALSEYRIPATRARMGAEGSAHRPHPALGDGDSKALEAALAKTGQGGLPASWLLLPAPARERVTKEIVKGGKVNIQVGHIYY